jgi:hypothetical protein
LKVIVSFAKIIHKPFVIFTTSFQGLHFQEATVLTMGRMRNPKFYRCPFSIADVKEMQIGMIL